MLKPESNNTLEVIWYSTMEVEKFQEYSTRSVI